MFQNINVIAETEMLAQSIQQSRNFNLKHAGVVFSHDVIGRRHGKVYAILYSETFGYYNPGLFKKWSQINV